MNGFLCTTIRNRKNICTTEIDGDDVRESARGGARGSRRPRSMPKTDSRNTQNMIEPSSPPQYDVIL